MRLSKRIKTGEHELNGLRKKAAEQDKTMTKLEKDLQQLEAAKVGCCYA